MKTRLLILILLVLVTKIAISQTSEKNTGFSDIKLSYALSSMSAGEDQFVKNESKIPFGIALETNYSLSKKLSFSFGIEYRTTGNRITDSFMISDFGGYSGVIHIENKDLFLDIPMHLNFKVLNTKPFNIMISAGPKETINYSKYYGNPDRSGKEQRFTNTSWSTALDFGIIENVKIYKNIGVFASQFYGYYFIGGLETIGSYDLKFGLLFNFK
jgi:hypothetical protein